MIPRVRNLVLGIESLTEWIFAQPWLLFFLFSTALLPAAALRAAWQPLWFDEIVTRFVALLPSFSEVVRALSAGTDQQPPLFYVLTRAACAVGGDHALALRIPGIVGFWVACLALFRMASRLTSPAWGAVAVAFFLTSGAEPYLVEARPYGLLLGFSAAALLCWQEYSRNRTWPWAFGLLLTLSLTVTVHYYGFLLAIPIGVAECLRNWENRRVDPWTWGALILGVAPLPFHYGLVRDSMKLMSGAPWNGVDKLTLSALYSELAEKGALAGVFLILAVSASLFLRTKDDRKPENTGSRWPSCPESALWVVLVALPLAGLAIAFLATRRISPRYVISSILGMSVAFAVIGHKLSRGSVLAGTLLVTLLGGQSLHESVQQLRRASQARPQRRSFPALAFANRDGLPLVVGDLFLFADWYNAAPPRVPPRLFLVDTEAEMAHIQTDSASVHMPISAPFVGWPVSTWKDFTSTHRSFLLVSQLQGWVLAKAIDEGGKCQVLQVEDPLTLYLIELPATSSGSRHD